MTKPKPAILAGDRIVPFERITGIDVANLTKDETVVLFTQDGDFVARGSHAIEAVMLLKPSALEGRRLLWDKGVWAFHNLIGHPAMQVLAWLGFPAAGIRFHDWTVPHPKGFK